MSIITLEAFTAKFGCLLANSKGEPITFVKKEGHVFLDDLPSKTITGMIIDGEYKPWSEIGVGDEDNVRCFRGNSKESGSGCANVRSAADVHCLDLYPVLLCRDHANSGLTHVRQKHQDDRLRFRPIQSRLAFELRRSQVLDVIASGAGGMTREQLISAFSSVKAEFVLGDRGGVDFDSAKVDMEQLKVVAQKNAADGTKESEKGFYLVGDNNRDKEQLFFVFDGPNAKTAMDEGYSSFPMNQALLFHRNGFEKWERADALLNDNSKGFPISELVGKIFRDLLGPCPGDKGFDEGIWVEYPRALDFKVLAKEAVKVGVLQDGTVLSDADIERCVSDPLSLLRGSYDGNTVRWHVMGKSMAYEAAGILNNARSSRDSHYTQPYSLSGGLPYQRESILRKAMESKDTWEELDLTANQPSEQDLARQQRRVRRNGNGSERKVARRRARQVTPKLTRQQKQAAFGAELEASLPSQS